MPIKFIGTIVLVVLVAVLTGFNLSNKCNIWFFHTFKDVPVFAALLGSFVLGVIVTLPFTFGKKKDNSKKKSAESEKTKRIFGFNKKKHASKVGQSAGSDVYSEKSESDVPRGEPSVTDEDYVPPKE